MAYLLYLQRVFMSLLLLLSVTYLYQGCVKQAEFVQVLRKTKRFYTKCLRMAIMIEKNVDVDSNGVTNCTWSM
jgi:hypothetical protein